MKYGKHNFIINFHNAVGMKDRKGAIDMLSNELADVIQKHYDMVAAAYTKATGNPAPKSHSEYALAEMVVNHLDEPKMQDEIVKVIVHHHKVHGGHKATGEFDGSYYADGDMLNTTGEDVLNAGGEGAAMLGEAGSKIGGGAASGGVVGAVAGAVDSVFSFAGKGADKKNEKEKTKQQLLNALSEKQKMNHGKEQVKKALSPLAWTGIIVGSLAVIGFVGYLIVNRKK